MSSSSEPVARRASVLTLPRPAVAPVLPELVVAPGVDPGVHLGADPGSGEPEPYEVDERAELLAALDAERAGLAAARRSAEQLVGSLAAAVEDLRHRRAVELAGLDRALAEAAIELASAVLGREATGADALARGLALAAPGTPAVARLHPSDLDGLEAPPGVELVADPGVGPGGCVVEIEDALIDAQLGPAVTRARAALLDEQEEVW
jgi:flagellar assembly protein FliH